MRLPRQQPEWYDRLANLQSGYFYPWRSQLEAWHGEDVYQELVSQHVRLDADVLDVACGHGEVALTIAPHVRSVFGYDRTAAWVELAQRAARERDLPNATFRCHDSSSVANDGQPHIPAPDSAFDLLICSKGPFHWIEDARRVARPGATLLMLVPDAVPLTAWHPLIPEELRWQEAVEPHWALTSIEKRLTIGGLSLHSWWSFDVPEIFPDPRELYVWLAWGCTADEVPSFSEVRITLENVFARYGSSQGVAIRHRRYLWKSVI